MKHYVTFTATEKDTPLIRKDNKKICGYVLPSFPFHILYIKLSLTPYLPASSDTKQSTQINERHILIPHVL